MVRNMSYITINFCMCTAYSVKLTNKSRASSVKEIHIIEIW